MATQRRWHQVLAALPADGGQVWVRRIGTVDEPVLATWAASSQTFTVEAVPVGTEGATATVSIPVFVVQAWRSQSE